AHGVPRPARAARALPAGSAVRPGGRPPVPGADVRGDRGGGALLALRGRRLDRHLQPDLPVGGAGMTAWQFVAATWPWEPSVVLGCAALGIGYLAAVRWRLGGRAGCFLAGVVVLLFALDSPLDTLADVYLFTAHMAQHLLLLLILAPLREARLAPVPAMLYLLAAALAGSVLGIVLTFARAGLYPEYLRPVDVLGIEPLIRAGWGLSPDTDQQIGGLLMWIPGGLVYLCAMLGVLMRWYRWDEQDAAAGDVPAPGAPVPAAPVLPAGELHAR